MQKNQQELENCKIDKHNIEEQIVGEVKEGQNTETILAQWQTCVEMANSISERRDSMNNIFITINLALIAAVSFTFDMKSIFILSAGIILCILWRLFIRNYKELNTAKFKVIYELENKLPFKPFKNEWELLKESKKYKEGTELEKILPWMFGIIYAVAIIAIISSQCQPCIGG